jgi:hypothetical protein
MSPPGTSLQTRLARFTFAKMLVALVLTIIGATSLTISYDSDSWWALRTGQSTWEHGIAMRDLWSFTVRGGYWPNHSWLTQLLLYLAYLVGGLLGPILLCATIATATWYAIYRLCGRPQGYRALVLLLGMTGHLVVWNIRPHLLTLLLLAVALLLIRWRYLFALPPIFLLWANLHGGFGLGGLALVAATFAALLVERRMLLRWVAISFASGAATLANPLGIGLWTFTLSKLATNEVSYIEEWLPPALDRPVSYPFFILVALWAGALIFGWRRIFRRDDPERHFWITLLLLSGIYAFLGFRSIRHTPLFIVAAMPLILHARVWQPAESVKHVNWRTGLANLALLGAVALGGIFGVGAIWQRASRTDWRPLSDETIAAVRGCQGNLYNTFDLGGPLLWFVPERPVFVDSRTDPYPPNLLLKAVTAEQHGAYPELFSRYDIRCALVPTRQPIYDALRADQAWIERFSDSKLAVFHRSN